MLILCKENPVISIKLHLAGQGLSPFKHKGWWLLRARCRSNEFLFKKGLLHGSEGPRHCSALGRFQAFRLLACDSWLMDLFAMPVNMLLLIAIRPNTPGD